MAKKTRIKAVKAKPATKLAAPRKAKPGAKPKAKPARKATRKAAKRPAPLLPAKKQPLLLEDKHVAAPSNPDPAPTAVAQPEAAVQESAATEQKAEQPAPANDLTLTVKARRFIFFAVKGQPVSLQQNDKELASLTTDGNGNALFPNLAPGTYAVVFKGKRKDVELKRSAAVRV